jgi:hypothetical protein
MTKETVTGELFVPLEQVQKKLQLSEAQDKSRTCMAASDILRQKWHRVKQAGPTQRKLILVCYVTPSV